jgi:hypothetical protein
MMIELGSNQFEIDRIDHNGNSIDVSLTIIEGPNANDRHVLKLT